MLIAVDTNVLLDQALDDEDVWDAIQTIQKRLPQAKLIVPPTVLEELGMAFAAGTSEDKKTAHKALSCMRKWGYEPLNVIPVGKGIAEQVSYNLRSAQVLPDEEVNDSFVIAESAIIGCAILLTSDHHLLEAQAHPNFRQILADAHLKGEKLTIATPRKIASFQRR